MPSNAGLLSLATVPVGASGTLSPSARDALGRFRDEAEEASESGGGQRGSLGGNRS